MPSNTERLIASIQNNPAFTQDPQYTYDNTHPLDSLDHYAAWLAVQRSGWQSLNTLATANWQAIAQNDALKEYLALFGVDVNHLADYQTPRKTDKDKQAFLWACNRWLDEQFGLIANVLLEDKIKSLMGAENREQLRGQLDEVGNQVKQAVRINTTNEQIIGVAIALLNLKRKPNQTSVDDLLKELNKRLSPLDIEQKKLQRRLDQLGPKLQKDRVTKETTEFVKRQRELGELLDEINPLEDIKRGLLAGINEAYGFNEAGELSSKSQKKQIDGMQKAFQHHVETVQQNRGGLDGEMQGIREDSQNEMGQLYAQLLPLMEDINTLRLAIRGKEAKLTDTKTPLPQGVTVPGLLGELRSDKLRLTEMLTHKDEIFLQMGAVKNRLDSAMQTYTGQINDEQAFEEETRRQLDLLRTLPKFEEALNVYCASYRQSFPLFLYIGNLVAGDGAMMPGESPLSMVRDFAMKLPLVGIGITDIEKAKAYDTGSTKLSLKLGVSLGLKYAVEASVGLAVEYNAGLSVSDYRNLKTLSEFVLIATGKANIPKLFTVAMEVELGKWSGGFSFQDHYHWAAWLAARWARFIARAKACDLYMSDHNIANNYVPDQRVLADVEKLAEEIFQRDKDLQAVHQEIKQYLAFPVTRTEIRDYFKGGNIDFKSLNGTLDTAGNLNKNSMEYYTVKNENGKAVEYVTTCKILTFGVSAGYGGYTIKLAFSHIEGDPKLLNNINTLLVNISPNPPVVLLVKLLDAFLTALAGTDPIPKRVLKLSGDTFKLAVSAAVKQYASQYVLAETKSTEIGFGWSEGQPTIWYIRTRLDFAQKFSKSIPVYKAIYIDVGAAFQFDRTTDEILGWGNIMYTRYLYTGLMQRAKMPNKSGGSDTTLRPDSLSGEALWKQYLGAHKHQYWHLFLSIAAGNNPVTAELANCRAKAEAKMLTDICKQKASSGRYALPKLTDGFLTFLPAILNAIPGTQLPLIPNMPVSPVYGLPVSQYYQVGVTTLKQINKKKDNLVFESYMQEDYNAILPVFQKWLEAEYTLVMKEEGEKKTAMFKPVFKPVSPLFKPQDGSLLRDAGWATQLQQQTGKDLRACISCLNDVGQDYEMAEYLLSVAVLPEKYWVKDDAVSACPVCQQAIQRGAFSSHKHHCRICGGVFCDNCCRPQTVATWISSRKIRVCVPCQTRITTGDFKTMVDSRVMPKPKPTGKTDTKPVVVPDPNLPLPNASPVVVQKITLTPTPRSDNQLRQGLLDKTYPKKEGPKSTVFTTLGIRDSGTPNYKLTNGHLDLLKRHQCENVPIPADGDCLFSSLINMGAFHGTVRELREAVALQVEQDKIDVRAFMLDPAETAREIRTPGRFNSEAGDSTPSIVASALKVNLIVFNPDGRESNVNTVGATDTYRLIRFVTPHPHYHATRPIPSSPRQSDIPQPQNLQNHLAENLQPVGKDKEPEDPSDQKSLI